MKPLKRIDFAPPPALDKVGEPFEDDDEDDDDDDGDEGAGLDERVNSSASGSNGHRSRQDGSGHGIEDTAESLLKRTALPQLVAKATASSSSRPGPGITGTGASSSSTNIINGKTSAAEGKAAGGAFGRWL